jgi:cell division protein FtsL
MARQGIDLLLKRAEADTPELRKAAARDKRYIYNGDPQARTPGYAVRPNRKAVRRKISTFNLILWLFGVGIAIVLYVDNNITINRLAFEVNQLQTKYDAIANNNATLRAEVTRKAAWERIGKSAKEQLGLMFPTEQPTLFNEDQDKIESLKAP